jgi:hypothetical protein
MDVSPLVYIDLEINLNLFIITFLLVDIHFWWIRLKLLYTCHWGIPEN